MAIHLLKIHLEKEEEKNSCKEVAKIMENRNGFLMKTQLANI